MVDGSVGELGGRAGVDREGLGGRLEERGGGRRGRGRRARSRRGRRSGAGAAGAAPRRCGARTSTSEASTRSQGARSISRSGSVQEQRSASTRRGRCARRCGRSSTIESGRPVGGEHAPAGGRGREARQAEAAARAPACARRAAPARRSPAPAPARSATARPSTGRNSSCSNASSLEQRFGVARTQQAEVAPADPHHLFDEIVHPRRRMAQISAPPRVTSVDVARKAGVSQSTVSLVLSGKAAGRISARTEEAVRAAAQELGYRPNVAARALRTGVARSVALVVPDITNPFFGRVLRGAQRAAQSAGYTVVLVDIGNDRAWEAASLRALLAGPADGLLLFEVELPPGASEHAIEIEMTPGQAAGRAARRRGRRGLRARAPARARAHAGSPTSPRASTRRPSTCAASGSSPTSATSRRPCARRSPSRAPPRPPARCWTRAASPPSSATTTSSPAASTSPPASAGSRSPATCPSSASTTSTSPASSRPPLTTVAVDAEGLGAAAFEALATDLSGGSAAAEQVMPVSLTVRESTAPPRDFLKRA